MLMSISMMDWSFWSSWFRLMSQCDGSHTSPGLLDACNMYQIKGTVRQVHEIV